MLRVKDGQLNGLKLKQTDEVFKNVGSFFGHPYQFNGMKIQLGMALRR